MATNKDNRGFLGRLKQGLAKTKQFLLTDVDDLLQKKEINPELFDELEAVLIAADIGPLFTHDLIEKMKDQVKRKELDKPELLKKVLRDAMTEILKASSVPLIIPRNGLFTIMVVGVNGTGKTTTIGKLAYQFKNENRSVMLAAADTFRAAAIEQLEVWSKRVNAPLIKQQTGSDPSAVVYDAISAAKASKSDIVIIDTAGRLHTKVNLMEELKKMKRIMGRELPGAPHETLLVLDATTGQNAISQAQIFNSEIGLSGIILTKLDGTSKGGMVIRIARELKIPIRYIGIGEGLEDLRKFDAEEFVNAIFE